MCVLTSAFQAGCLSLEEELIDTTTEEGRKKMEEMGRAEALAEQGKGEPAKEAYPDPE